MNDLILDTIDLFENLATINKTHYEDTKDPYFKGKAEAFSTSKEYMIKVLKPQEAKQ